MHKKTIRDTAAVTTTTFTTHVVDVDLADLLGTIDVAGGQVVVSIRTPNGRTKRVTIPGHMLVAPAIADNGW